MGVFVRSFGLLMGLILAGWVGVWAWLLVGLQPVSGLRVEGRPFAELDQVCAALESEVIVVEAGAFRSEVPRASVGSVCDRDRMNREANQVARRGHPVNDLREYWEARRGGVDIPLSLRVDEQALAALVERLRRQLDRAAIPATVDLEANRALAAISGSSLHAEVALRVLRRAVTGGGSSSGQAGTTWVKLPTVARVAPGFDPGKNFSLERVLAEYETEFYRYGDSAGRAHNVSLAASRIDGAVIAPLGTFSFNERVGPRRHRDGFRTAKVIIHGELVDGAGGGVCQAASTLHAAAFFAGLTTVEYEPHSRPSSYIPMGLDATVVWPYTDLKLQNPFDFPVVIRSIIRDGVHRVEIRGQAVPRDVEFDREFVTTRSFTNRVVPDPSLGPGQRVVAQGGIRGYTVRRIRWMREGDRTVVDEDLLEYPPTDRIVRVGGY